MTHCPGKHDIDVAGRHRRDVDEDASMLRYGHRIDVFLLLIEDPELVLLQVTALPDAMRSVGIELLRYPIADGGVPADPTTFRALLDDLTARLHAGQQIVVACRGGFGRTGTVVACVLRAGGLDPDAAIRLTRDSRRWTIENRDQERFVREWAA
jgi:protein-tyrosine phosphatase